VEDPTAYVGLHVREEYFGLVQQWNASWSFRARLRIHLGDDTAVRFLDYQDDGRPEPKSLHYRFVSAHRAVLAAESSRTSIEDVQGQVDRLNHAWSDFADDIAVELTHRARSPELLEEPHPGTERTTWLEQPTTTFATFGVAHGTDDHQSRGDTGHGVSQASPDTELASEGTSP
jgi:hypothetical protein